jgi:hypothetical protein
MELTPCTVYIGKAAGQAPSRRVASRGNPAGQGEGAVAQHGRCRHDLVIQIVHSRGCFSARSLWNAGAGRDRRAHDFWVESGENE